jgi:glycosyltransferase involved in cell wall biosynthesis
MADNKKHILVFEPRLEGHHLSWLRYIVQDFLDVGYNVTMALDGRSSGINLYKEHIPDLLNRAMITSVFDEGAHLKGGTKLAALEQCFKESGASHVFVNNLDDIASKMLRRAAWGLRPPQVLKGRLSGIYFRPRFLTKSSWSINTWLKKVGFRKLVEEGWFHRICLLDEYLYRSHKYRLSKAGLTLLPDTWSGDFSINQCLARKKLGISTNCFVFLHYGIGTRRKGLHLIVQALQSNSAPAHWHLLCAGQLDEDKVIKKGIHRLVALGRATLLDRYVSKDEEAICFCSSNVVMLPYVQHFGSSGVLSLAAAAGKRVIAADDGLIGLRVRRHRLGLVFKSGDAVALSQVMHEIEAQGAEDIAEAYMAASEYARSCERCKFRKILQAIPFAEHGKPNDS